MKPWRSFRARLMVASVVWTMGLLYVTHVVSVLIIVGGDAFPRVPRVGLAIAAVAMVVGILMFRASMKPFAELRKQLGRVRDGRASQVSGDYLSEIQPLVNDLNALLAHREQRVREAVAKAGDLAHGLKTPLAVLAQQAERLSREGHHALAATLTEQVERMRRQVDYHLAHARAAASGATPGARCLVRASADAIARTLGQLHLQRGIAIEVRVPETHAVRCGREDLDEMLGNLVDNACKWARARVVVASALTDEALTIAVDDDGCGIPVGFRDAVLARGVRADQAAPGTGLGLAIVRDLTAIYGGRLALGTSPLGGLRAELHLPAAPSVQEEFSSGQA
jgi:signal transduction histidine kinase